MSASKLETQLKEHAEKHIPARFEFIQPLGHGVASQVFAVRDTFYGTERALKLCRRRGQKLRFKNEFLNLASFDHPHIVKPFDFGQNAAGLPYYTMDWVKGGALDELKGVQNTEVLTFAAIQILDALATLHARGFVHRDLKPKNILVSGKDESLRIHLIDLGLLGRINEPSPPSGTLPFMAPETAQGENTDGRADLYSLGVVLYDLLLPEKSIQTLTEASLRMRQLPPSPTDYNPIIPRGFSDFILRLLHPDKEQRFANAEVAYEVLVRLSHGRISAPPPRQRYRRLLGVGAISNRERLRTKVLNWFDLHRQQKRGELCLIESPQGLGKTPFLSELAAQLMTRDWRVLRIQTQNESGSPLKEMLKVAQTLAAEKQSLNFNDSLALMTLNEQKALPEFIARTAWLLAKSFGNEATAIVLDDLHKADAITLEVLHVLTNEIQKLPIVLLVAADPRGDGQSLAHFFSSCTALWQCPLLPLDQGETEKLMRQRLHGLQLPEMVIRRIVNDTQGMPSLVERTLVRLLMDKTILAEGCDYIFQGGRYQPVPKDDEAVLLAHFAQLKLEQRYVLWAAAILGQGLSTAALAKLTQLDPAQVNAALAHLARLDILDPGDGLPESTYKFATRSLRNSVYQAIPLEERRLYHDRAAQLLQEIESTGVRIEERVEHLLKGSNDSLAITAAIAAGNRAVHVYADKRAIEYYARAYARINAVSDPRTAGIALKLGEIFARTGELERAYTWFQTASVAPAETPYITIEANLGLGSIAWQQGRASETAACAASAATLLQKNPHIALQAETKRLQAFVLSYRGEIQGAERLLREALNELESAGIETQAVEVLLALARLQRQRGDVPVSVNHARQAFYRAQKYPFTSLSAEAATLWGRGLLRSGRLKKARAVLTVGLKKARNHGDRIREAMALRQLGNIAMRRAKFKIALRHYNRALELSRLFRVPSDECACLYDIGIALTQKGEFSTSLATLNSAVELSTSIGDAHSAGYAALQLAATHLLVGDSGAAQTSLRVATHLTNPLNDPTLELSCATFGLYLDACTGHSGSNATIELRELPKRLAHVQDPTNRAWLLSYSSQTALLWNNIELAREHAELLHQEVKSARLGDFLAHAQLILGRIGSLAPDKSPALTLLQKSASGALKRGQRPTAIEALTYLGRLTAPGDAKIQSLTTAMELARTTVRDLSSDRVSLYLARPSLLELRRLFQREYSRAPHHDNYP